VVKEIAILLSELPCARDEPWLMRSLGGCHHPIIEIRICGIRAHILVDLWRVSVGPFPETLGAAIC
jgi:hypothetical protein